MKVRFASAIATFRSQPHRPIANNLTAIRRALEDAGVEFTAENGGGAGVRHGKVVE